jgi:mevalonate kinase
MNHDFSDLSIEFYDPSGGCGGFGASSAQFAMLYKLHLKLTQQKFSPNLFIDEYRKISQGSAGVAPSGADCMAQYLNHSIFFDAKSNSAKKIIWNFPDLDFAIFKTDTKVNTHLHLRTLDPFDVQKLQDISLKVEKSFVYSDGEMLIRNVQKFFHLLEGKNLVIDQTVQIVDGLLKIEGVKAAKGCGALCADTILLIFEKNKKDILFSHDLKALGLKNINGLFSEKTLQDSVNSEISGDDCSNRRKNI